MIFPRSPSQSITELTLEFTSEFTAPSFIGATESPPIQSLDNSETHKNDRPV